MIAAANRHGYARANVSGRSFKVASREETPRSLPELSRTTCVICAAVKLIDTSRFLLTGASRFVLGHGLTPRRLALPGGSRGR